MIELLNAYFVPVYSRNEDVRGKNARVDPQEFAEHQRYFKEFQDAGMGGGAVWIYIMSPEAKVMPGIGKHRALSKAEPVIEMLKETIEHLGTKPGPPVVKPRMQAAPPNAEQGSLMLHVTARGFNQGSWRQFPGENWIALKRDEWTKLLPPGPVQAGSTWEVDPNVARKILTTFYPPTEDPTTHQDRNRFESHYLRGKVLSVEGNTVRARLDSKLRMRRSFYPNGKDDRLIEATSVGFIEFTPDKSFIQAMEMATHDAWFGDREEFGVGVRTGYEAPKY